MGKTKKATKIESKKQSTQEIKEVNDSQKAIASAEELDRKLTAVKLQIETLLKENNAALVPVTIISNDKVLSRIDIVPATKS